jgi:hypothetical protein
LVLIVQQSGGQLDVYAAQHGRLRPTLVHVPRRPRNDHE